MNRPLRLVVLTTDTAHHRFFLRQLVAGLPAGMTLVGVGLETASYPWRANWRRYLRRHWTHPWRALALNPYWSPVHAARAQAAYEAPRFFPDDSDAWPQGPAFHECPRFTTGAPAHCVDRLAPDLLFVYGTGVLPQALFGLARIAAINAHGGLLPGYRGLDTNLWAVYEGRPQDMAVTLHHMEAGLDTGAVLAQARLDLSAALSLASLRYHTTLLCTRLALALLAAYVQGQPPAQPHAPADSRYYGPMPWLLKRQVDRWLQAHTGPTWAAEGQAA